MKNVQMPLTTMAPMRSKSLELTNDQKKTLQLVCDTFIPSLEAEGGQETTQKFWKLKASDLEVDLRIRELIATFPEKDQQDFKKALDLLNMPLVGFLLTGSWGRFHEMLFPLREKWLQGMSKNFLQPIRQAFATFQKLTCFIFYSDTTAKDPNPTWEAIGYPGPLTAPPMRPKRFAPTWVYQPETLGCDVLVIGSGAGGGVVAGELAEAGYDVLVVEKGYYLDEGDFTQKEAQMVAAMYEKKGGLATADGSMTVFAGSCLGGGTVINWAGTLRTPSYILEEWAKEHDTPHFLSKTYEKSLEAAEMAIGTNTQQVAMNTQNQHLFTASEKLGHLVKPIPQNIVVETENDQRHLGYSCFGDQHGNKQSMLNTYLKRAALHKCRFLVNTEADHVTVSQGQATGAVCWQEREGKKTKVVIKAGRVVVAAGAIHTPAILMRSGLTHPEIGKNLNLHPVVSVSGIYPEPVRSWWGGMMTVTNDHFTRLDGNFGFKLETPPAHTGVIGMSLPWKSGKAHKEMMLKAPNLGNFIVLTRDKFAGNIATDKNGKPVIHYHLHPYDLNHLLKGMEASINLHLEAGASQILIPHQDYILADRSHAAHIGEAIRRKNWRKNSFMLFSAHQMSSCRMGGTRKLHPVSPTGETWDVKGLYVADASALPRCSGANPMLSIEALAHYIAQGMK
jgi:choline dehydrogenase-like flavoprotein